MALPVALISEIARFEHQDVEIRGWLHDRRSAGMLHFLQVRDGSGLIEAILFKGDVAAEVFERADYLSQETSLKVRGVVRANPRSPVGFELGVKDFEVVHEARDYPLPPQEQGVATLMEKRHLWLRAQRQSVILRVRHTVVKALRDYFDAEGFTLVDAPVLTPAGDGAPHPGFEVPYFELGRARLSATGQHYLEAAAMALGRVYSFGPTFHAEKAQARPHLTESWRVEPEAAYMTLAESMDLAEDVLCFVVQRVLERHARELTEVLERDVSRLQSVQKPFPRITYTELVELLQRTGNPVQWGEPLGPDEEAVLAGSFDRPLLVHRAPVGLGDFSLKKDPEDARVALGLGVLAPEGYGELLSGGQREEELAALEKSLEERQQPREALGWYLDLRRFGSVPHAGFGLGVERTVAWLCGLRHVRETIPFARMIDRITP